MTQDVVCSILSDKLGVYVDFDSTFEEIGLSDIDLQEAIAELEDRLIWLYVPDNVWSEWTNVKQIIDFINEQSN